MKRENASLAFLLFVETKDNVKEEFQPVVSRRNFATPS